MKIEDKSLLDFQSDWEKLVDKGIADYPSMSHEERIWFNIQSLIQQADNGGLISYYYNSGADWMKETIEDLVSLGFPDIADMLIEINQLFPDGEPPADIDDRNEIISEWADGEHDDLLDELDSDFYSREAELERVLINYIETKIVVK